MDKFKPCAKCVTADYCERNRCYVTDPCHNRKAMGKHACFDRSQCWEPCGLLGKSESHASAAEDSSALNRAVPLQVTSEKP